MLIRLGELTSSSNVYLIGLQTLANLCARGPQYQGVVWQHCFPHFWRFGGSPFLPLLFSCTLRHHLSGNVPLHVAQAICMAIFCCLRDDPPPEERRSVRFKPRMEPLPLKCFETLGTSARSVGRKRRGSNRK